MTHTNARSMLRLLAGCAFLVAGLAHAQYAWVDASGTHHYSDQPPPPGARVKLLKAPPASRYAAEPAPDATAAATATTAAAAPADAAPTLAAREANFQKRLQERAKAEQKSAEEAKRKSALADQCASLREYKAGLDSGMRMAVTNANGEREFLSDEERARRRAKANAQLSDCR